MAQQIEGLQPEQYTILVVDDNTTNLNVISNYLQKIGFRMLLAKNGEGGIQRAIRGKPDLILLDVMMPGIDGFETCQQLKENELTSDIAVIFMTALTDTEHKVKGFQVGGVDYITKPIQHEEVLARVTTHLKIRNLTRSLQTQNKELQRLYELERQMHHIKEQRVTELAELNASKDKFFSIVAHDLKGPFLPLLGNLELMTEMMDTLKPQDFKSMSMAAHRSARRVYELLNNLLQWALLQLGRMEYQPQSVELADLARKSIDLLANNANLKGIKLVSTIERGIYVMADVYMLNTVIRNLTSNALKFTPLNGQVTLSAQQIATESGDMVEVAVLDTGVGIPEEVKKKLFKIDQHVTTIGTGRETGTGLGLIMCQEMVVKSGGRIWIESEWGKGTAVKFMVRFDKLVQSETVASAEESKPTETVLPIEEVHLIAPPVEQLQQYYDKLMMGNMLVIKQLAKTMSEESEELRPFADKIIELATNFEDEELLVFLQKYMIAE